MSCLICYMIFRFLLHFEPWIGIGPGDGAPHQGGLWKAAVESTKWHMVRVIGKQSMWHDQLITLMARIEAWLNSRPLIALHDEPDEHLALRPGDFRIGDGGSSWASWKSPRQSNSALAVAPQTSRQWSDEYLTTLHTRSKWQRRQENIQIGVIVAIKNENLPPTYWRLGRIIETHPGGDVRIRNVAIKHAGGTCTTAVQKLCLILSEEIELSWNRSFSRAECARSSESKNESRSFKSRLLPFCENCLVAFRTGSGEDLFCE